MRVIKLLTNNLVIPCPKCGNNSIFEAYSERVGEDIYNVWVVCQCGYDPTEKLPAARYEDVYGGTHDDNIRSVLSCWNDAIEAMIR